MRALVADVCRSSDVSARVDFTEGRGHARALARDAAAADPDVVVAWGGDGTVNEVASALVDASVPLGIVAGGSGNGLARALDLSLRPADALRTALTGVSRRIDAATIGDGRGADHVFFNVAGLGLDALVATHFNGRHGSSRGFSRYIVAGLTELLRYRPETYRLDVDGESQTVTAVIVAFANGTQYGNNTFIAPASRLDDGLVDLVVVEPSSLPSQAWRARRLFTGRLLDDPLVQSRRAHEIVADTPVGAAYHYDGECAASDGRLVVRSRPAALAVRCRPGGHAP